MTLQTLLRERFHFDTFRPGQQEAIEALLKEGRLLCIQPTGYGKSLLYQLPSCLLGGLTLVISPLLALMRDQIHQLGSRFNISAASLNTDQTPEENEQVKEALTAGQVQILFVAPEQLDHIDRFAFLQTLDIRLMVIDEAHCISTWGHDFRPSYRQILHLLSALQQQLPALKVLALTATANAAVEKDIQAQLGSPFVIRESMRRDNLSLHVHKLRGMAEKLAATASLLSSLDGTGLIYCATRENVELVTECLQAQQLAVAGYHAGKESQEKQRLQHNFLTDHYKAIVATNALGMGIDKGNLRFIIHFDIPGSITAYYQEVGRCGRDGLPAQGHLLFDPIDRQVQEYFIESALPLKENFDLVLDLIGKAPTPPNLTTIKTLSGLHPTRVTIILAELIEQGFIQKSSLKGSQVYTCQAPSQSLDLSRYQRQHALKTKELGALFDYATTRSCRFTLLQNALGDPDPTPCGRCDRCHPTPPVTLDRDEVNRLFAWLNDRPFPIPSSLSPKLAEGLSLFDSTLRSPLFKTFMQTRQTATSFQELDPEFITLLLKHFGKLVTTHAPVAIIPIPSKSWKTKQSLLQLLCSSFNLPILDTLLSWKEEPAKRQGELLNNDQRHENVHRKLQKDPQVSIPKGGPLILFDDYAGSLNTLKEAARALRQDKTLEEPLIPFTIARVKWHLGKPGFA